MLNKHAMFLCILFVMGLIGFEPMPSEADGCSVSTVNGGGLLPIGISVSCAATTGGSQGTVGSGSGSGGPTGCYKSDGTEVDCWFMGFSWNPTFDLYCHVGNYSADNPLWDSHRDSAGNPIGTLYECLNNLNDLSNNLIRWADDSPVTPPVPGTDPETLVRTAVAQLGLHPPEVGVGAYVYPNYTDWGLSWWVGAPMWLWTDSDDDLQWGTHTISASDGGLSVTATVTSTSVAFDPGDGGSPVTCSSAGTSRPWNPDDLLSNHSPSGCEYTYMTINTPGDKDSRYTVSAEVTWTVTWSSSDGQYGTFTTTMDSTDNPAIHVGQLRTVLVTPPSR